MAAVGNVAANCAQKTCADFAPTPASIDTDCNAVNSYSFNCQVVPVSNAANPVVKSCIADCELTPADATCTANVNCFLQAAVVTPVSAAVCRRLTCADVPPATCASNVYTSKKCELNLKNQCQEQCATIATPADAAACGANCKFVTGTPNTCAPKKCSDFTTPETCVVSTQVQCAWFPGSTDRTTIPPACLMACNNLPATTDGCTPAAVAAVGSVAAVIANPNRCFFTAAAVGPPAVAASCAPMKCNNYTDEAACKLDARCMYNAVANATAVPPIVVGCAPLFATPAAFTPVIAAAAYDGSVTTLTTALAAASFT